MMETASKTVITDENGVLRVEVPTRFRNKRVKVVVVFEEEEQILTDAEREARQAEYRAVLARSYGALADDPMEIPYDPPIIPRETVD
jgi:hypothetical protein